MKNDIKIIIENIVKNVLKEEREIFTKLYHGTDIKSALKIKDNGIDITKGEGYFGTGFYTTPNFELAKSNYADFAEYEDEEFNVEFNAEGAVLEFDVIDSSKILDLRDPNDWEKWKPYGKRINDRNLYKELIRNGIYGLWDDSMDGVIIYNPKILKLVKIHKTS